MKPGTMSDAIKKGREYGGFAWQFAPPEAAAIGDASAAAPAAAPVGDSAPQPSVADGSVAEAGEGAEAPAGDDDGPCDEVTGTGGDVQEQSRRQEDSEEQEDRGAGRREGRRKRIDGMRRNRRGEGIWRSRED